LLYCRVVHNVIFAALTSNKFETHVARSLKIAAVMLGACIAPRRAAIASGIREIPWLESQEPPTELLHAKP